MKKINFSRLALTLALVCSASFIQAADVYVSNDGVDTNGGTSPTDAVATLSKAYDLLGATRTGTIYVSGTVDGSSQVASYDTQGLLPFLGINTADLTIQGVAGTDPKIENDGTIRIFRLRGDNVLKLKDLTFSSTNATTFAGGCGYVDGGSLEADHVVFENFTTSNHGAVFAVNSISTAKPLIALRNCTFRNNKTTAGNMGGSVMRVNDFGDKAGIKVYIENCVAIGNTSDYGAFFFRYTGSTNIPEITFINSTFKENVTGNGNGGVIALYSANQTVNVINCTIKDNTGRGAINSAAATFNIYNSILEGNSNQDFRDNSSGNGINNVANSFIFTTNQADYTKPEGYTTTNQLLGAFDPETNSYTPLQTSLAINFGAKQYALTYDQLGNPRPFTDDLCDAGAIETDKIAPVITAEAQDEAVDYNLDANDTDFAAWLAANGNAEATDRTAITWSNDFDAENWIDDENNGRHIAVTFTATDAWGNATPTTATFTINGTITGIQTTTAGFIPYRADGKLIIQSGSEIFRIELISVSGQTIRSSLNNEISLGNIGKGVYLIKINNNVVRKVIL
ncbi:hypothetical protein FACS189413_18570 [Bacteroidia bacterium]|nr:hypothetical protein FACS189413_18570 [Bacteroidia bacterium]